MGSRNSFYKGLDSKYFRLCRPHDLLQLPTLPLPVWKQSYRIPNEWGVNSSKTSVTKTKYWVGFDHWVCSLQVHFTGGKAGGSLWDVYFKSYFLEEARVDLKFSVNFSTFIELDFCVILNIPQSNHCFISCSSINTYYKKKKLIENKEYRKYLFWKLTVTQTYFHYCIIVQKNLYCPERKLCFHCKLFLIVYFFRRKDKVMNFVSFILYVSQPDRIL